MLMDYSKNDAILRNICIFIVLIINHEKKCTFPYTVDFSFNSCNFL